MFDGGVVCFCRTNIRLFSVFYTYINYSLLNAVCWRIVVCVIFESNEQMQLSLDPTEWFQTIACINRQFLFLAE